MSENLVELAFLRWHHDKDPEVDWTPDEDAEIVALRERVRRDAAALAAASTSTG